jgi:hypothetical protein
MSVRAQYSIGYVLAEIGLIAIAFAAGRFLPSADWLETQALCICIALTSSCGALGGLCLRMTVGLIAGGVFSVASIPLLWLVLSSAT